MLLLVAAAGLLSLAAAQGVAADNGKTQCTGSFTGTTKDLVVPAGGFCIVDSATIQHDLTIGQNADVAIENTTIGHDLSATAPQAIITGWGGGNPGPVRVGHDLTINGSDAPNGIGYDLCDTTVDHDLQVTNTVIPFEIFIGDKGGTGFDFCEPALSTSDHVGHDLVVANNRTGRIDVGDNTIGHDLRVVNNTASTDTDLGDIDVSDNSVGHDALCSGNNPPPSKDGPEDGSNHAGHTNTCG